MPFGTDVGLGPGHMVLDGDPATGLHCYICLRPRSVSVQVCRYYGLVDVITVDACTCFPDPGTDLTPLKRV